MHLLQLIVLFTDDVALILQLLDLVSIPLYLALQIHFLLMQVLGLPYLEFEALLDPFPITYLLSVRQVKFLQLVLQLLDFF